MKLYQHIPHIQPDFSGLFLYGAIMFANIDYLGVLDYVIKAICGGAVWFGFKLLQDHYSMKIREKARSKDDQPNGDQPNDDQP